MASAIRQEVVNEGWAWTGDDLVPDEQLVASSHYRDFLSKVDIRWLLTGCVFNGANAGMCLTVRAVNNSERNKRFDIKQTARHRMLLRHLSRAIGAMYRLRDLEFRGDHIHSGSRSTAELSGPAGATRQRAIREQGGG